MRNMCSIVAIAGLAAAAAAQPSGSFTYQGLLEDGGAAVNGVYDMRFRLLDGDVAANLLGQVLFEDVLIEDGLLSVELDFGRGLVAPDTELWLLPEFRDGASTGSYTALLPQRITSAPFAANTRGLEVGSNGFLHVDPDNTGFTPQSQSPIAVSRAESSYVNVLAPADRTSGILFGNPTDVDRAGILYAHASDFMSFRANGNSEKMRLLGNGNLGLGTATPAKLLDVAGQAIVRGTFDPAAAVASDYGLTVYDGLRVSGNSRFNSLVEFGSSVDVGGGLDIGTEGLGGSLTIEALPSGNAISVKESLFAGDTFVVRDDGRLRIYGENRSLNIELGESTSSGNRGRVGVADENELLQAYMAVEDNAFSLPIGVVRADLVVADAVSESDRSLKQDIEPLARALESVTALRGTTFLWKDRPEVGREIGFIAQEIEQVAPSLVHTHPDGLKSVAYAKTVPLLVEAIKEQQQQIEELRGEIDRRRSDSGVLRSSLAWPIIAVLAIGGLAVQGRRKLARSPG